MEGPGCDERNDGRREKPAPYWRVEEDEEAVGNGQYKLRGVVVSRWTLYGWYVEIQRVADLDQNELVEQDSSPHIGESDATHDDQGTDHEALGPCFKSQFSWLCRLFLLGSCCVGHFDGLNGAWGGRGCGVEAECQTISNSPESRCSLERTAKAGVFTFCTAVACS